MATARSVKAEMSSADTNDLPDSDFAYIEPGGTKDSSGKTVPRSLRHFPINDAAHVRNALAQLAKSPFEDKARPKVEAAAKKLGIGEPGKASEAAGDASAGASLLSDLYCLISAESTEPAQLSLLQQAASLISQWLGSEQGEIGSPGDEIDDDDGYPKAKHAGKTTALKAEPMGTGQFERWLKGEIPRRILVMPFGGPIPSPKTPLGLRI